MGENFRLLSLDGGGLRGLITARILQRLNDNPVISGWLNGVDLLAGTSTGGILALALAAGEQPQVICSLYKEKGRAIFDDSIWDDIRDLGKIIGADYSNKNLKKELRSLFGSKMLKDFEKKVVIPAFDLDNEAADRNQRSWKPKIFHNYKGADSDGDELAANIALYTSSAPAYFPSADGYIDGGVFANNPGLIAIAQAISHKNMESERKSLPDLVLLSIGTGVSMEYISGNTLDWGYAQWIKPLIKILMDGVSGISDYQSYQLLGDRYHRLQIPLGNEIIELDDADKIERMDDIGKTCNIDGTVKWIKQYWH